MIAVRNLGFLRNDRDAAGTGIFSNANDFNDVAFFRWDQRKVVKKQTHLDDLDRFFPRHVFADENIDFASDEIVHEQFLAGELLIKPQHVSHVAVWKLQAHHLRCVRLRIRGRGCGWCLGRSGGRGNNSRDGWCRTRGGLIYDRRRPGRLRHRRNLSEARTGCDKQQNRSVHEVNVADDAIRCARAGQFALALGSIVI